jgi:hypothetical protein
MSRLPRVEAPVAGELVSFRHTFTRTGWDGPRVGRGTLRFLGADALSSFLSDAGPVIEEQCGDWDRSPLTGASPEIITIARSASFLRICPDGPSAAPRIPTVRAGQGRTPGSGSP